MTDDDKHEANPGFVWAQLARALSGIGETASKRVRQWTDVLRGLSDGSLDIGSRRPAHGFPVWVTLEVTHGGFATGRPVAGGALLPHERDLATKLELPLERKSRGALNLYYLSDAGRFDLTAWLNNGLYRVSCLEEAALLTVQLLLQDGQTGEAERILGAITPFFEQLRFYPSTAELPVSTDGGVHVQTVEETVTRLQKRKPSKQVLRMREALLVWAPAYDRLVELFLEIDQAPPNKAWLERAAGQLEDYARLRHDHRLCTKPDKPRENYARLRRYAKRLVETRGELANGELADIRKILDTYTAKYGRPDGERLRALRTAQSRNASLPTFDKVAGVLAARFEGTPRESGDPNVDAKLAPANESELELLAAPASYEWPAILKRIVARCYQGPLEKVVERGLVGSGESLATLIPTLTANAKCSGIADLKARRLYTAAYTAFRTRRSLLLLNLESQVKFGELPWIASLEKAHGAPSDEGGAKDVLRDVSLMSLRSFPQTITPNKLVQELKMLSRAAGLHVPLVDELAADIFMGAFSPNYVRAAQAAGRLLRGSLYERYFGLDYGEVLSLPESDEKKWGTPVTERFAQICAARAGVERGGYSTAKNGMTIEQSQVLTTHNLASLFGALDLADELGAHGLQALAQDCFRWLCKRQQLPLKEWHARLTNVKNSAYAWRQMVFFVALLPEEAQREFLDWSDGHLSNQSETFRTAFAPALGRLKATALGQAVSGPTFYGWATGRHWLLEAK